MFVGMTRGCDLHKIDRYSVLFKTSVAPGHRRLTAQASTQLR